MTLCAHLQLVHVVLAQTCIDDALESECLTIPGGLYYGDNTDCSEGICDSPPTGACCVEESCTTIPEADCATNGGTYQGSGTTCVDNPCVEATGACCTEETCTVETTFDCLAGGGTYLGDGITCDDSPCEVGACCVTEVCVEVTEEKCATFNGLYQDDGTSCDDDPCALLDPSGACCVDDDVECTTETEASCLGIGGAFQGDNTTCSDNTCDPTGACCIDSTCQIEQEEVCEDAGARIREMTPVVKNTHAINLVLVALMKFASKCTKANVMNSQRASILVMVQVAAAAPASQD